MFHLKALVLLAVFGYIVAETTQKPHMHHESTENDHIQFTFEGSTGLMVVQIGDKCYLWAITPDEHSAVHTDAGLRQIELRILREINAAIYTVVPQAILAPGLIHACHNSHTFYLVH